MAATLSSPVRNPGARILASGSYLPPRIVSNEEICQNIDSTPEWIVERSGIENRRWADADVVVTDMGQEAAAQALERSGVDPGEVSAVIIATSSHDWKASGAGPVIASGIGAVNAAAYDIGGGCATWSFAMAAGADMIRAGSAKYVVVVGVEKLTDWLNPLDRATAFIFSDGAGAVVLGPSQEEGLGPAAYLVDGTQARLVGVGHTFSSMRRGENTELPTLAMDGQQVFRWAVGSMPRLCRQAMELAGVGVEDLAAFIPHQANQRITDAIVRGLKLPEQVVVADTIRQLGNSSAASIPIAIDVLGREGKLPSGELALTVGFGGGLAAVAQVVVLP